MGSANAVAAPAGDGFGIPVRRPISSDSGGAVLQCGPEAADAGEVLQDF
jgi:hypothetical protein